MDSTYKIGIALIRTIVWYLRGNPCIDIAFQPSTSSSDRRNGEA